MIPSNIKQKLSNQDIKTGYPWKSFTPRNPKRSRHPPVILPLKKAVKYVGKKRLSRLHSHHIYPINSAPWLKAPMPRQVDAWWESLTGSNPLNFIQHVILTPTHSCWKLKHHKNSRLFGSVNGKLLHAFRARLFFLTIFAVRVLERRTLLDGLTKKHSHLYRLNCGMVQWS